MIRGKNFKCYISDKMLICLIIFLVIALTVVTFNQTKEECPIQSTLSPEVVPPKILTPMVSPPRLKKILFYNSFFGITNYGFGSGRDPFIRHCTTTLCSITSTPDRNNPVESFDALIFHAWDFPGENKGFPPTRKPHQRYIFFTQDTPDQAYPHYATLPQVPPNFFNWTMTYRVDSDIKLVYGLFKTTTEPLQYVIPPTLAWKKIPNDFVSSQLPEKLFKLISHKTEKVAWYVSHCSTASGREEYAKELGKYIKVDIYGSCGSLKCPRGQHCLEVLQEKYKFYLSFENSICRDYVTEKFFNAMIYNVVPVVYGGNNYTLMAPPGSYIDINDFDSPRLLAEYLLFLDANPEEYAKYFWWKDYYVVSNNVFFSYTSFCQLCLMLHDIYQPVKTYDDIVNWFMPPGECRNRSDYLRLN